MTKAKFAALKNLLIKNADLIQKLATQHHKVFLGGQKFRSEVIKKYQKGHIQVVHELANHLEEEDIHNGTRIFKKLAKDLAENSVKDKLTIEEAVDGIAFLKQAIWQTMERSGLITPLSATEFYQFSQRIGTYVDIVSSKIAFSYHQQYLRQMNEEKNRREKLEDDNQKARDDLHQEQLMFQDLLMKAPAVIAILKGRDHVFEMVNQKCLELIGKTKNQIIGKKGREVLPELEEQGVWKIFDKVYKKDEAFVGNAFLLKLRNLKNNERYFNFVLQPIPSNKKTNDGIFIHGVDVTDQVKALKKVEENEARLEMAQKIAKIGTYDWDLNNGKLLWTSELQEIYGYKVGTFNGSYKDVLNQTFSEDKEMVKKSSKNAIENNKDLDIEYRIRKVDGSIRWVKASGKTIYDELNNPLKMLGTVTDITEKKYAEEALKHYAAIVESSDDAIISKSLDGIISSWNKGAEKLYGYKADEIIGKAVSVLMPPQNKNDFPKIMKELIAGRKVEHYETKRLKKNGEIVDVSITVSPLKDNKGRIIGASKIARDITERKKLDQQKDDFISIATHELKTPVTSIKAYAQVLQSIFIKQNDLKSAGYLGKMDSQLNKLTSLIADLLDVTKIQSGQLEFREEDFNLADLVEEVSEELQRTTAKHTLITDISNPAIIRGDKDRIEQVLTNLISNAIKYSPNSDKIIIKTAMDNDKITLSVQDFGVGIPKEKQDKVFEKFFRVSGPKQDTFPGMGLGLYISSEIIKRQNGKIWVESAPGKGSIFCFSLPLKK